MKDSVTGNKTVKIVVIAIVIVIAITILYNVYKASQAAGNAAGEIAGAAIIQAQTGISKDRQSVCEQAANDCKAAITFVLFTKYPFWVNDTNLVNALNRLVTANEAVLTSEYFRQVAGTSLLSIVNNRGVFTSKANIKTIVLNALT